MTTPTIKQLLAAIIAQRFPWLLHVVTVASDKGRGLALRTASGLLHLAGGPDDPGVVRVGDAGTAGTIAVAGNVITFTNANGETLQLTFGIVSGSIVINPVPSALSWEIKTKSTEGSGRVTCA